MTRTPLRAPTKQYGLLVSPEPENVEELLENNSRLFQNAKTQIAGLSLQVLRTMARQDALAASQALLNRLRLPVPYDTGGGFIVTGHQPELHHPGVWIKNFAAAHFARRLQRQPMNFIVDADLVKSNGVTVPNYMGETDTAHFDDGPLQIPYEERKVRDEQTFDAFPAQVSKLLGETAWRPLVIDLWKDVSRDSVITGNLGERFTIARHHWEHAQGCDNLEIAQSALCESRSFHGFVQDLLENLPRFGQVHNERLAAYRKQQRIRSRNHPVPELERMDDWQELPLWAWQNTNPRRRRLFARRVSSGWQLAALGRSFEQLPGVIPSASKAAENAWRELAHIGWRIRSRALTTTMFTRLAVADLFIHGIGGGIYDQLTDEIIRRYYGMEPPAFLVISGTLRLPWSDEIAAPIEPDALAQRLRNLRYHPERYLPSPSPEAIELLRKHRTLRSHRADSKTGRYAQFMELKQINSQLRTQVQGSIQETELTLVRAEKAKLRCDILRSREYSLCLHSERELLRYLSPFLHG